MGTEKYNMILKLYPEEMQLSEHKRTIWIHQSESEKIPKHILKSIGPNPDKRYYFDVNGWVIDREAGEKVIRNNKTANKPNMQSINGQAIWNGSVDRYARNRMKKFLTEYFRPSIVRQLPERIFAANRFFHFEFIFYMPISLRGFTRIQDIDNHAYPYVKAFTDTLQALDVITSDNAEYYRGYYPRYVDIPTEEDRRLEIKVHFCENNERIQ